LALERALDRKLETFGVSKSGEASEDNIQREAEVEVGQFFSRFPDARPHEPLLAKVLADHPDLSLEAAYFQTKEAFAMRGYDWTRTLDENVREEAAASGSQEQPT